MNDLMIDLETLGTDPNTPVISIGAIFFDIASKTLGGSFYMALDINEQIARGRKPTGDTLKWWLQQADAAKKVFHEKAKPVPEVLNLFNQWFKATNPKANAWGNGSTFDISIMEDMFKDYKLDKPWSHNKVMDLRTFRRFCAKGASVKKEGTDHNALDDAISQAKFVLEFS